MDGDAIAGIEFSTADDRMQYVCRLLESRDGVTVAELASFFGVSEVTVRSDLAVLARRGLIARIRGGARALQRGQSEVAFDVRSFEFTSNQNVLSREPLQRSWETGEAIALDSKTPRRSTWLRNCARSTSWSS